MRVKFIEIETDLQEEDIWEGDLPKLGTLITGLFGDDSRHQVALIRPQPLVEGDKIIEGGTIYVARIKDETSPEHEDSNGDSTDH